MSFYTDSARDLYGASIPPPWLARGLFERYFNDEEWSDIKIEVHEEGVAGSRLLFELPGHTEVLGCAFSEGSQLRCAFSGFSQVQPDRVRFLVPPRQEGIALILIRGMYENKPSVSCYSDKDLVQLLRLAGRYSVPKVLLAVTREFKARALRREMLRDTAQALLRLRHEIPELDGCRPFAVLCEDFAEDIANSPRDLVLESLLNDFFG